MNYGGFGFISGECFLGIIVNYEAENKKRNKKKDLKKLKKNKIPKKPGSKGSKLEDTRLPQSSNFDAFKY